MMELNELYSRKEALIYVNEQLAARGLPGVSEGSFITHIYDEKLHQIEPIYLGERTGEHISAKPYAFEMVFTRRMLDEYLENREHNRQRGVERKVTRPSTIEADELLLTMEAVEYMNDEWRRRKIDFEMSPSLLQWYRENERIPYRLVGATLVYRRQDLGKFVEAIVAQGGWSEVKRGRKRREEED